MKSRNRTKLIGLPHLAFALATASAMGGTTETATVAPAPAPSCLDWIKVSGYAALAYTYTDSPGVFSDDKETFVDGNTPFDAVKVGFQGDLGSFGGYVSLFYTPGILGDDAGILDAYATYKAGDFTFTARQIPQLSRLRSLRHGQHDANHLCQQRRGRHPRLSYRREGGLLHGYLRRRLQRLRLHPRRGGFWTGDEEFATTSATRATSATRESRNSPSGPVSVTKTTMIGGRLASPMTSGPATM